MGFGFLRFSFPFVLFSFFALSCTGDSSSNPSKNRAPIARLGDDVKASARTFVNLDGSESSDPDGDSLDFEWKLVPSSDGKVVEDIELVNERMKIATLNLPYSVESFVEQVVELTVSDGKKSHSATLTVTITPYDYFSLLWNGRLAPAPWDQDSNPYFCFYNENPDSPWVKAGLTDLEGQDPLSLIRYYGNGSYLRYSVMGFGGCTTSDRDPNAFYMDPPADPTYYSTRDINIYVDIIRVPLKTDSGGSPIPNENWFHDNGTRTEMSMVDALALLNDHVATYYTRASEGLFNITFLAGLDMDAQTNASLNDLVQLQTDSILSENYPLEDYDFEEYPNVKNYGTPGGLSRVLLYDVPRQASRAFNSTMSTGLDNLANGHMSTILHEIGHGWMNWAHSFPELPWEVSDDIDVPNPYSNRHDFMSSIGSAHRFSGWNDDTFPLPLAINRYSAGWIDPEDVALHTTESGTYTLVPPLEEGKQFLVIHSGRPRAFTILEVLEDRDSYYREAGDVIYDSSVEGDKRPRRYNGVFVSRYDQSTGSGTRVRFGPALHNEQNPNVLKDAGVGRDDASVLIDGETASLGGDISVSVAAVSRSTGNYTVTVSGGKEAPFPRWCRTIVGSGDKYDPDCLLNDYVVAQAGPERQRARGGATVNLDGRDSFGRSEKRFRWTQESGTSVTLTGADTDQASFTAPAAGASQIELVFRLTVSLEVESGDESGTTKTHTDDITVYIPAAGSSR